MLNEYLVIIVWFNLNLIIDDIECIDEIGILSLDGKYYLVDIIIFGIGFVVMEFFVLMNIVGCCGCDFN